MLLYLTSCQNSFYDLKEGGKLESPSQNISNHGSLVWAQNGFHGPRAGWEGPTIKTLQAHSKGVSATHPGGAGSRMAVPGPINFGWHPLPHSSDTQSCLRQLQSSEPKASLNNGGHRYILVLCNSEGERCLQLPHCSTVNKAGLVA